MVLSYRRENWWIGDWCLRKWHRLSEILLHTFQNISLWVCCHACDNMYIAKTAERFVYHNCMEEWESRICEILSTTSFYKKRLKTKEKYK